jgi:hypothetical protein
VSAAERFIYSPWRHGGWYVDNVRYPSGAAGCVSRNYPDRKWRIACDDRPDAFERFTYRTRDEAAAAERDLIAVGVLGRKSESSGRKVTLERLAERHEISTAEANSAGSELAKYLADPATIKRFVAVTRADDITIYAKAEFDTPEAARRYVDGLIEDLTFPELPLEIYDLDTGEQMVATLVAIWGSPQMPRVLALQPTPQPSGTASALRSRAHAHDGPSRVGPLLFDPDRHRVTVEDRPISLTNKEFALLGILVSDPTRVFTKEELLEAVWGHRGLPSPAPSTHTHRACGANSTPSTDVT